MLRSGIAVFDSLQSILSVTHFSISNTSQLVYTLFNEMMQKYQVGLEVSKCLLLSSVLNPNDSVTVCGPASPWTIP